VGKPNLEEGKGYEQRKRTQEGGKLTGEGEKNLAFGWEKQQGMRKSGPRRGRILELWKSNLRGGGIELGGEGKATCEIGARWDRPELKKSEQLGLKKASKGTHWRGYQQNYTFWRGSETKQKRKVSTHLVRRQSGTWGSSCDGHFETQYFFTLADCLANS
jgi:hypothetical protein